VVLGEDLELLLDVDLGLPDDPKVSLELLPLQMTHRGPKGGHNNAGQVSSLKETLEVQKPQANQW
jgi:hypothetical protein